MTAAKALEISRAYVSQGCLCGHESAHIDLDTAFHGFFGLMEKLLARFGGQIAFAASLAHLCGDCFEYQGSSVSLEGRGHGAGLCLTVFANDALHGFLLIKNPGSQCSESGS